MSATLGLSEPFQPSDAEVILAREASRALANLAGQDRAVRVEATETAAKRREHDARHRALDELVQQAQELGLGY
jgi:hypothetical protein